MMSLGFYSWLVDDILVGAFAPQDLVVKDACSRRIYRAPALISLPWRLSVFDSDLVCEGLAKAEKDTWSGLDQGVLARRFKGGEIRS